MFRASAGVFAAALAFTLAASGDARAAGPVSPTGKGIVGGALLGGEVVTITMGAIGLEKGWPYFVFGGVGMVGGGVGGYFLEQKTKGTTTGTGSTATTTGGTPEPALYMLAGGLALVIPALIISLNATAYKPPESDRTEPAANEPAKDGPKVAPPAAAPPGAGPAPAPPTTSRDRKKTRGRRDLAGLPHIPVSLLDVYHGKVALGLPAFELKPLYTHQEVAQYGVAQGTEVKFPVFKAMF
jgi:hypothetical protein